MPAGRSAIVGTVSSSDPKASAARSAGPELGRATWREVADGDPRTLLVPVGSCEQHGPHLPLDTDTRIARAVAANVAASTDGVVLAPPVAYGSSGEHQAFAGTLSIGTEALTTVLVELGRSAFPGDRPSPFSGLVFVNGHGGNLFAVRRAVEVLVSERRPASSWAPAVDDGDAHAGRTETSLLLAIEASAVRDERPVGATGTITDLLPALRRGELADLSPSGVLGDATGATVDEGRRILTALVDDLRRHVAEGPQHDSGAPPA